MRFLSVAERELRAVSRQKSTYHVRWITSAVFFALLCWLMWAFNGVRTPQIFRSYSWLVFIYCLLIGTARTADCLSAEKREGTLGLMFLTNLNAPEIIGGKLCSSALAAAYGLWAIFPLLALQMLIGGITLSHFWRTVLALANTVFFSVSAGFLASSFCVRQFTAIASATGLAVFFSGGLMAITAALNSFAATRVWVKPLAIFSPLYTLVSAEGTGVFGPSQYWTSLLAVFGLSTLWLALATWQASRSWRDRPVSRRSWMNFKLLDRWRERARAKRAALRRRLLAINPFFWLGGQNRISAPLFMTLSIFIVALTSFVAAPFFGGVMRVGASSAMVGHLFAWLWGGLAIHALVLYYAAMIASRRLAEDKQTGALELILSTPTTTKSISRGLWLAYGRKMFFPALLVVLVHFFFLYQAATMFIMDSPAAAFTAGLTPGKLLWHAFLNHPVRGVSLQWEFVLALRVLVCCLAMSVLVWITLGSLGRWLGLRMRHPGFAPMVSLGLLLAPPVVLFTFLMYCANESHLNRLPDRVFAPMVVCVAITLGVIQCLLMYVWSAGSLRHEFRTVVTSHFQPVPLRAWWLPNRRSLVRFGIGFISLTGLAVILVLSFYGYQNWSSRKAWSSFQKEIRRRHESLDVAQLLPGPVAPDKNFALNSEFRKWAYPGKSNTITQRLLAQLNQFNAVSPANTTVGAEWTKQVVVPLGDYLGALSVGGSLPKTIVRSNTANAILRSLQPYDESLSTLAAAARLPYFQISTNRDSSVVLNPPAQERAALESLFTLFQIRSSALLAAHRSNEAAADLLTSLQLVRHARQLTDAQAPLHTQTIIVRSLQPLWEGIIEKRWSASQLAAFQKELTQFNFLMDYTNAVRRIVLAHMEMWSKIPDSTKSLTGGAAYQSDSRWELQPRDWWLNHCLQLYQAGEAAIKKVDVGRGLVRIDFEVPDLEGLPLEGQTMFFVQQPYWQTANAGSVAFAQNVVNQSIIACALERFRLAESKFPERLEELVPNYLSSIPNDVVRAQPLLFEKPAGDRFILRSVGPDHMDDRKSKGSDDWLWAFPTNAPPKVAR